MKETQLLTGLLNMAEGMLVCGSEISRVEDTISRMGLAYGASHMNVFVITSCIIVTMGMPDGRELTQTRRVTVAGGTDFYHLEQFNALSRRCCAGLVAEEELEEAVRAIEQKKPIRWRTYLGSVLAAGGFAVFFGGSLLDGCVASLFALLICFLQEKLQPISINPLSFNLICSLLVGVATGLCANVLTTLHLDKILIGYIMLLIPGLALTNAVRNVLVGNTISGVMRLVEAVLWASALALGFMTAMYLTGGTYFAPQTTVHGAVQILTAAIGALGFSLIFNVRDNLLLDCAVGGLTDWAVYMLSSATIGGVFLSSAVAAAYASLYSEAMARIKKTPATVFYVPALIPLVPGGSLFYTMSCAVMGDWVGVGQFGSSTLYCALGIAVGMSLVLSVDYTLRKLRQK